MQRPSDEMWNHFAVVITQFISKTLHNQKPSIYKDDQTGAHFREPHENTYWDFSPQQGHMHKGGPSQ